MNGLIVVICVVITAVLMVSTNGLCAMIAMALTYLAQFYNGNRDAPAATPITPSTWSTPTSASVPATTATQVIQPKFRRSCLNFTDCSFDAGFGHEPLWLACPSVTGSQTKFCSCEHHWGLVYSREVKVYKLTWNEDKGLCFVSSFGPCGWNKGLQINCQEGEHCFNGRCRQGQLMGKGTLGHHCGDDMDCQPALECATSATGDRKNFRTKPKECLPRHRSARSQISD